MNGAQLSILAKDQRRQNSCTGHLPWNGNVVWQVMVAVDGLTVTNLTSNRIEGYGYDPGLGANDHFVIETATGTVRNSKVPHSTRFD
jgi:hypothetical protein